MKKLLPLFFLLPFSVYAQTDTLYLKTGVKHAVTITNADGSKVHYSTDAGKSSILKSNLADFYWAKDHLYKMPLPINEAGRLVFTEVVKADGKTAEEIYSLAKEWAAKSFSNSNWAIKLDDPAQKKIIAKGMHPGMKIYFTLTMEAKDGRFKYAFEDITTTIYNKVEPVENYIIDQKLYSSPNKPKYLNKVMKTSVLYDFQSSAKSLTDFINKPTVAKQDW